MTNQAHADMDDTADYAVSHPEIRRRGAHRALPISSDWPTRHECEAYGECNEWPARRGDLAYLSAEPAPVIVDRLPEEWDEDQSESADGEVASVVAVVLLVVGAFWALVKFGGLA